jgi:DNA-binding MarR family transcriptional regulator
MSSETPDWRPQAAADTVRIALDLLPRFYRSVAADLAKQPQGTVLPPRTLYRLLGLVAQHPGTNLTDLAGRLGMTKTNASPLVEKLVQEGLLVRTPDPEDRRIQLLSLTAQGTRTFDQGWQQLTEGMVHRLTGLEEAQGEELARALRVVVQTLPHLL